jgi:hypothetical protein
MNNLSFENLKRSKPSVGQKHTSGKPQSKTSKSRLVHHTPKHSARLIKDLIPEIAALRKLQLDNDEKKGAPYADLILSMKTTMRSMFDGDRPYHFFVGSTGFVTCFGTVGNIASNITFAADLVVAQNWSALVSLFDEFAYVKSQHEFSPLANAFNVAGPGSTFTAFDDDGLAGVPTSNLQLASYPSVKMHCPAVQGATLTTEANSTGFKPISIRHSRPYPLTPGPVVNAASTGWVDCGTPSNLLGSLLVFNSNVSTTNNAYAYVYLALFEIAFRCVR